MPNPCDWTLEYYGTGSPDCYFACPAGDTDGFEDQGWYIYNITIVDLAGNPIPGIAATDFWVYDCDDANDIALCGGSNSCNADGPTDANGVTHMRESVLVAGGYADGLSVICMGVILQNPTQGCADYCLPVSVRSPDIDGSLAVDLTDLSIFAGHFLPPMPYDAAADLNCDGIVDLVDLARFAMHFGPPGHNC
jgi:hypothetical protein